MGSYCSAPPFTRSLSISLLYFCFIAIKNLFTHIYIIAHRASSTVTWTPRDILQSINQSLIDISQWVHPPCPTSPRQCHSSQYYGHGISTGGAVWASAPSPTLCHQENRWACVDQRNIPYHRSMCMLYWGTDNVIDCQVRQDPQIET